MPTVSMSYGMSAGGVQSSGVITRDVTSQVGHQVTLPAGQAGTITTRTDNDTGVITLDSSAIPTVTTSNTVAIFWSGGYRYNMTVTNVTGSTITVDGGSGTNLPVLTTAVVIAEEVRIDTDLDGDLIEIFSVSSPTGVEIHWRFDEGVGTDATPIKEHRLPASESDVWHSDGIFTNPLAGVNIGTIVFANGGTSEASGVASFAYSGSF